MLAFLGKFWRQLCNFWRQLVEDFRAAAEPAEFWQAYAVDGTPPEGFTFWEVIDDLDDWHTWPVSHVDEGGHSG